MNTGQARERGHQADLDEARQVVELIDRTLQSAGIYLAVELRDGAVILSGAAIEPADRQAALDIAIAVAGPRGLAVEDAIEVMDEEAGALVEDEDGEAVVALDQALADDAGIADADVQLEIEPDFTGDTGTTDSQFAAEEAVPYFPPTDPVIRTTNDGDGLDVVGGFAESAMDEPDEATEVYPNTDDDLAEAVRRELREDAATADLVDQIRVVARDGIVVLRGDVETIDDVENVEAVAGRVVGVVEVREELDVAVVPHPEVQEDATG
jgi:osmotically-inducible protein OsmY